MVEQKFEVYWDAFKAGLSESLKKAGLSGEQIYEAGRSWAETQLSNETLSDIFPGMTEILESFKHVKMGVCSQNGTEIIRRSLEHEGVLKYIEAVVGYDDVAYNFQKPDPAAFTLCLEKLEIFDRNRRFVYIGDHSVDVAFGRNAEAVLKKNFPEAQVICVALHHKGLYDEDSPDFLPDYSVHSAGELLALLKELDL